MKATAYNTFGTAPAIRVVASFDTDASEVSEALREATYLAALWNRTEDREDMKVNFISCGGKLKVV